MDNRFAIGVIGLGIISSAIGYVTAPRQSANAKQMSSSGPESDRSANRPTNLSPNPFPFAGALRAAGTTEEFRSLLESVWSEHAADPNRNDWLMATIANWIDLKGSESVSELNAWPAGELRDWIIGQRPFLLHRLALQDLDGALGLATEQRVSLIDFAPLILERYPDRLPGLLETDRFRATPQDWRRAGKVLAEMGAGSFGVLESWLRRRNVARHADTAAFFESYAAVLAKSDPDNLLAWATKIDAMKRSTGSGKESILSAGDAVRLAVIRELQESDSERARMLAAESPLREAFMAELARDDLAGAVDWLLESSGNSPSKAQFEALLPHLDRLSVMEAFPYLERFDSFFSKSSYDPFYLATAIVESRGVVHLAGLAEDLTALPPSLTRDALLAGTLAAWASHDSEAALGHALAVLKNGGDPIMANLLVQTIARDSGRVMEFASALPETARAGFLRKTAHRAVRIDIRPFADAVAGGITQPGAEEAVAALVEAWGEDGFRAPAEWLSALPAGASKDAGIVQYVAHIRDADLPAALQWAQSVRGDAARLAALQASLHPLAIHEPQAAVQTVERLGLASGEREALLDFIQSPPRLLEP